MIFVPFGNITLRAMATELNARGMLIRRSCRRQVSGTCSQRSLVNFLNKNENDANESRHSWTWQRMAGQEPKRESDCHAKRVASTLWVINLLHRIFPCQHCLS